MNGVAFQGRGNGTTDERFVYINTHGGRLDDDDGDIPNVELAVPFSSTITLCNRPESSFCTAQDDEYLLLDCDLDGVEDHCAWQTIACGW